MSGIESRQMCPKCHECSHNDSREEMNKVYSCPSYTTSVKLSNVSTMPEASEPNFVYTRRKPQKNTSGSAIFSARLSAGTKKIGEDCVSVVSSCAPSVTEQHKTSQGEHVVEDKVESHVLRSESINGCLLVEERVSDQISKNTGLKVIEVDSINDSCSSSKSEMELASASMNTEEDTSQCSSSDAMVLEVLGEDISKKDLHASTTRSQGMLEEVWHSRTRGSSDGAVDSIASSSSWFCKICARLESPHKMLICDNCEEAFHLSCCNPRVKRIPQDEWFCHSCSKKRRKILTASLSQRYPNMIGEKVRCGNSSTSESNPIALMLRETVSYTTGVRIGKGFQAEVPQWSGPITNDVNTIGEALEMDPTDFVTSTESKSCKLHTFSSIGNWLQCKEVIDGTGESASGTICGKWRRAPLFEVQTDDWACFCCVLWDPIHADCAVPQELDTDQVLKQLKYIQMLRPQLVAKRRRLDCLKNDDGLVDNVEDLENRRTEK